MGMIETFVPGIRTPAFFLLGSDYKTEPFINPGPFPLSTMMNIEKEIQKLIAAKKRTELKLRELDCEIRHLYARLAEDRRCMTRKCPLDDDEEDTPIEPSR